ncbi:MAG: response regulator transcription factor [Verrucomicrobia bacterium]|nr:response regulator transcription factor [Verrucomicrobiota bacterium]
MKSIRILIADDHDIVREGMRMLLSSQTGLEICGEAANGAEAVVMANGLKPDVAILDYSMPEMNGFDAMREIHRERPECGLAIVTMHDSQWLTRELFAAGAGAVVLKTGVRQHLVPAVLALGKHRVYFGSLLNKSIFDSFPHPSPQGATPPELVTQREREIIQLVAKGKSSKEIAQCFDLSTRTVEVHRANIMRKLNVRSASELVLCSIRLGIIVP